MKIWLGRHGETVWNKEHRVQGSNDIALNENGLRLARETANGMRASGLTFDYAFSSPLQRAYDTASIIYEETCTRDASGAPLHPLAGDDRLREFCFGEGEGMVFSDAADDPSNPMHAFLYDPTVPIWPAGGETFDEVRARFRSFTEEVLLPLEDTCENVLLLCHGGIMREALDWITDRTRQGYEATASEFRNCSFHIIECRDGQLTVLEGNRIYY